MIIISTPAELATERAAAPDAVICSRREGEPDRVFFPGRDSDPLELPQGWPLPPRYAAESSQKRQPRRSRAADLVGTSLT
jgi:hypothetical protein